MYLYPQPPKSAGAPLDSVADARARMLVKLEAGCSKAEAISAGLNGADDVAAATAILDEILDERAALEAVPLDKESAYLTAISAKTTHLDAAKWVAAKKAEQGGVLEAQISEIG